MRLRIRRLGGIAGVRLRAEFDTSELPSERAAQVESAVRDLARQSPSGPGRPDAFRYEITQLDDPDPVTVSVGQGDIPPGLTELIEEVAKSGEIEKPDRSG